MLNVKKSTIFLVFFSFLIGFSYRHIELKFKKIFRNFNQESSKKFCPNKISNLPFNSTLIIGHAYGSQPKSKLRGDIGIAPKIYDFYLQNERNINSIIFSGDVLNVPSIKKWNDFYSKFSGKVKIFIAPGNHDVGENFDTALRDVFNLITHKNQVDKKFPFKLILNESLFIIADSNSKENSLDEILLIIQKEKSFKKIYVVMHHVLPEGLSDAANWEGRHGFIKDSFFEEKFKINDDKKIFFLYGDGGKAKEKPRIKCIKLGNSYHMVNGIGEFQGDSIFVISNNKLYRMEI